MKPNVFTVPQAFMRLFLELHRKENLMMKSVTCLVYLHRLHETVASYIANAEDKNMETEIGNELLQLSWAAVKHHNYVSQTTMLQILIDSEI